MKKQQRVKLIRQLFAIIVLQLIIIFIGFSLWDASQPINDNNSDIFHIQITVDDTVYERSINQYLFYIVSDEERYYFSNSGVVSDNLSNRELYESVSVGDTLQIAYYENHNLFGVRKWVVDARTETQIYRSLESLAQDSIGGRVGAIFVFVFLEFVYLICILCMFLLKKHKLY